jgi:hypothetical protein
MMSLFDALLNSERLTHSRQLDVMAFSDRLRQPDNLLQGGGGVLLGKLARSLMPVETHGFAPLPRGRFAFIVCNHRLLKIIAIAFEAIADGFD